MDIYNYLRALNQEKARVEKAIKKLEALIEAQRLGLDRPKSKRGRKPGMTAAEKQQISERMRRYWAQRRGEQA